MSVDNDLKLKESNTDPHYDFYDVVKPIQDIMSWFGLCPFQYEGGKYKVNNSVLLILYQVTLTFISVVWLGIVITSKFLYSYHDLSPIIEGMDLLLLIIHVVMINTFWIGCIIYKHTISKLFQTVHDIDVTIRMDQFYDYDKDRKTTFAVVILVSVGLLILFGCDFYIWIELIGVVRTACDVIRYWTHMMLFVMLLLLIKLPHWVKHRFKVVNKQLVFVMEMFLEKGNLRQWDISNSREREIDLNLQSQIRVLGKVHSLLADVVDKYSRAYGYLILFIYLDITLVIVNTSLYGILLVMGRNPFEYDLSRTTGIGMVWCIVLGIQGVLLDTTCVSANKQANDTLYVAQRMIVEIPIAKGPNRRYTFRDDLLMLVRQISRRQIVFTADGFFRLNLDLIYYLGIAIVTYLVISLQMHIQFTDNILDRSI